MVGFLVYLLILKKIVSFEMILPFYTTATLPHFLLSLVPFYTIDDTELKVSKKAGGLFTAKKLLFLIADSK